MKRNETKPKIKIKIKSNHCVVAKAGLKTTKINELIAVCCHRDIQTQKTKLSLL